MARSPLSLPPTRPITRAGIPLLLLMLAACGGSSSPTGPGGGGTTTLSGTVRATGSASALEGATVTIGSHTATTDANGHFELTGLPTGATTALAARPGYSESQIALTLSSGSNSHDFSLAVKEVYESGAFAMYVPAGVGPLRGVIISLGGGVTTNGFVTGGPLEPGAGGTLEQSLQSMGVDLRALAKSAHVALVGTSTHSLANTGASDNALFAALTTFAGLSGHAELGDAPVLMFGLGEGNSPESGGLASRNPQRTIGVLMRVPNSVVALTTPAALAVPTFVMLSELDDVPINTSVRAAFSDNRSRGGLWALATEPGVAHAEATVRANAANVDWMAMTLTLRLPPHAGDPLVSVGETTGWLGNQTTLAIAAWANYTGTRATASWLASNATAQLWKTLGGGGGPGT
ncbi:MAG: carboxypeptidase regulatory-like domain-containing protein [Gemmatimonadota bacterium]